MFQHVSTSFSHQKISETTRLRSKVRLAIEAAADGLNGFLCLLGIAQGHPSQGIGRNVQPLPTACQAMPDENDHMIPVLKVKIC
jgi:hypothetical protein